MIQRHKDIFMFLFVNVLWFISIYGLLSIGMYMSEYNGYTYYIDQSEINTDYIINNKAVIIVPNTFEPIYHFVFNMFEIKNIGYPFTFFLLMFIGLLNFSIEEDLRLTPIVKKHLFGNSEEPIYKLIIKRIKESGIE